MFFKKKTLPEPLKELLIEAEVLENFHPETLKNACAYLQQYYDFNYSGNTVEASTRRWSRRKAAELKQAAASPVFVVPDDQADAVLTSWSVYQSTAKEQRLRPRYQLQRKLAQLFPEWAKLENADDYDLVVKQGRLLLTCNR